MPVHACPYLCCYFMSYINGPSLFVQKVISIIQNCMSRIKIVSRFNKKIAGIPVSINKQLNMAKIQFVVVSFDKSLCIEFVVYTA